MKKGIGLVLILIVLLPAVRLGRLRLERREIDHSSPAWQARNGILARARTRTGAAADAARDSGLLCLQSLQFVRHQRA